VRVQPVRRKFPAWKHPLCTHNLVGTMGSGLMLSRAGLTLATQAVCRTDSNRRSLCHVL
jgi:hypothetical protein